MMACTRKHKIGRSTLCVPGQKLFVPTTLADLTLMHHVDTIDVLDRRQAMGDDDRRLALHQMVQRVLNQGLGLGIDTGGGFVE